MSVGLTSQTYYDNKIGDSIGLGSSGGMVIQKLGGRTYNLSLSAVIAKAALGGSSCLNVLDHYGAANRAVRLLQIDFMNASGCREENGVVHICEIQRVRVAQSELDLNGRWPFGRRRAGFQ